jgi:hypothetical protein
MAEGQQFGRKISRNGTECAGRIDALNRWMKGLISTITVTPNLVGGHNASGYRDKMSAKPKVRLWVIGPCLLYLFVFLLWFPRWHPAPQSYSARLLGALFLAITAAWAVPLIIGVLWYGSWLQPGLRDIVQLVKDIYETFFKKDVSSKAAAAGNPIIHVREVDRPPLAITKRLKNGTPVRGACPVCEVEFSTEAFDSDRLYPHESKLEQWYGEHFQYHLSDEDE